MAAANLPAYPEFFIPYDLSMSTNWQNWLDGFQAMICAMKVAKYADKRAMLLHYVGSDVRKLFKKLDNPGGDEDFKKAHEGLMNYFVPKITFFI